MSTIRPLRLFIEDGCNTNERIPGYSTPLHRVLRALHDEELIPGAKTLLKANSDALFVELVFLDGCLHKLLTRLSACNDYRMDENEAQSIVDLLKRGCNPCLLNDGERTPSDYALSPTAWPLWCKALERTGFDVAGIIQ